MTIIITTTPTIKIIVSIKNYFTEALWLKNIPKPMIEGTHKPTKTPASFWLGPKTPNQSEIENRNDKNAAPRIK